MISSPCVHSRFIILKQVIQKTNHIHTHQFSPNNKIGLVLLQQRSCRKSCISPLKNNNLHVLMSTIPQRAIHKHKLREKAFGQNLLQTSHRKRNSRAPLARILDALTQHRRDDEVLGETARLTVVGGEQLRWPTARILASGSFQVDDSVSP
jgi:hypothetical protein